MSLTTPEEYLEEIDKLTADSIHTPPIQEFHFLRNNLRDFIEKIQHKTIDACAKAIDVLWHKANRENRSDYLATTTFTEAAAEIRKLKGEK